MKKFSILMFFTLLGAVSLANYYLWTPGDRRLDRENRLQKSWPEFTWDHLWSGKFTRDLEEAYADRFLARDQAISLAETVRGFYGFPDSGVSLVTRKKQDLFAGETPAAAPQTATETEKAPQPQAAPAPESPQTPFAAPSGQWVNSFLIIGNQGYETAGYDEAGAAYYARAVNQLAQSLPPETRVFDVVVPSSIQFIPDSKYKALSYPQDQGIQAIYSKLGPRVTGVNLLEILGAHREEYLYHRTDHHWTGLGAYYAYVKIAEHLGVTPYPYNAYPKEILPNFWGTIYNGSRSKVLENAPDQMELVYPFMDHVFYRHYDGGVLVPGKAVDKAYIEGFNKYLTYIAGDFPWSHITSQTKNGRKVLVLKDSYANAFIPYLIPHYEEVHILDPRYWTGQVSKYVRDQGIQDVIVFNYYLVVSVYTGFARNLIRVTQ